MARKSFRSKRLFVLDTNVLMHDPTALFHFQEHGVFLPMVVLEELDKHKRGTSEVAQNARQASRFLDEMMQGASKEAIDRGLPIKSYNMPEESTGGRLFFQTHIVPSNLPDSLPGDKPDNNILSIAIALQQEHPSKQVTLVSKDINLRIKATVLGVHAEDYYNDQVLEDVDLLYRGIQELPKDFWERSREEMESWHEEGRTFYRITGPDVASWYPNQFISLKEEDFLAVVRKKEGERATVELTRDYSRQGVWGIKPRNREQNCALNLLMDPAIDFVTLLGQAGTGKTLLALAAGLAQTLDEHRYTEIIMTRATIPVGEDIGFLPGTEEEKMTPWMGALMDNLEVLAPPADAGQWGRAVTNDLLQQRIRIHSLNFMRGRTFLNKYIIIDEAQNLTPKQMKTLITRAGPGSKVICLGNVAQIDTPYLTETTSGLTYVVDRFKQWDHAGHITLLRGERSRLADYAAEVL